MKKVLLTAGAILLWTGTVCAGAGDMVRIPADDYRAIMQRLDTLQDRVDTLEEKPVAASPAANGDSRVNKLQQDVNNIYDTLDQVETKTLQDRLNFGGEYRLRLDSFKYEDLRVTHYTPGVDPDVYSTEHKDNVWTNRFRINMNANISRSLQFHGRLAVYHAWGDHDANTVTNMYNDGNAVHALGDDRLKVDRFYIDWTPQIALPVAITVGRHPSTEGPPVEFKENRERQSTYPSLIFDGEADGIVGTLGLENWTGLKKSGLRVAYGKVYYSDINDSDNSIIDNADTKDSTILAAFFETEIPAVDNSLMVLSYAHIFDMPAALTESGFTPTDQGYDGLLLGDVDMYGLHFQASEIGNSGLDLYVSGSINITDPEDNTFADALLGDNNTSFLTGGEDESHTGWAVVAGFRYELPVQSLNNPKLGFEYNHGSRYHFTMTSGANELYNKFATRGDAYELYYIQPASDNLFFRVGYTYVAYDYSRSGQPAFTPEEIDTDMTNIYMLMDVQF